MLRRGRVGEVYDIGGGHSCKNLDLVYVICRILAELTGEPAEKFCRPGDSPWDVVEYGATAACVSLTHHHAPSGAQCEDAADKSPQRGLIARFRIMRCHF